MRLITCIIIALIVWSLFIAIGLNLNITDNPTDSKPISVEQLGIDQVLAKDSYSLFLYIAKNNLKVCAVNLLGALTLGVVSLSNLAINGLDLGLFMDRFLAEYSLIDFFKATGAHSFEVIGLILSGAMGLQWGSYIFRSMFFNRRIHVKEYRLLLVRGLIVIGLTVTAAFLEAFVSIRMFI